MLTSLFLDSGATFFASGWTQFAAAFGVAFLIMLAFGRPFINLMHRWQKRGQPISENVPAEHKKKAGTPNSTAQNNNNGNNNPQHTVYANI